MDVPLHGSLITMLGPRLQYPHYIPMDEPRTKASFQEELTEKLPSSAPARFSPDPPIHFVTVSTHERRPLLTHPELYPHLVRLLEEVSKRHGWVVGRFTVLPDHIHFICSPREETSSPRSVKENVTSPPRDDVQCLREFLRFWKSRCAIKWLELGYEGALWQCDFFDRMLTGQEEFLEKVRYLRENAVLHGMCSKPEERKFQGEIYPL